jgi:hypothetical protein
MSEHSEQVALIEWCNLAKNEYPELEWIFAVPNGGHRHPLTAMKLKREGVKAGVFDLFLPCALGGFHGLFIEMKYGKNKLTDAQREFEWFVSAKGYCTCVCWSWIEAKKQIELYLSL